MEMSNSKRDDAKKQRKMIKDREKRFSTGMIKYFREYCRNTSIHGLKYLSEKRTSCERVWWIISILTSLCICTALVVKAYFKWQSSPVIVSFATKETPAWQVPFPAVTICPEVKSIPSKFNYTKFWTKKKMGETLTTEEEKKFGYLSLICESDVRVNHSLGVHVAQDEFFEFLEEVQPDFIDSIHGCYFMGLFHEDCRDLFFPVVTDEGLCYTFNLLDRTQMYRDNVLHYKNYHKAPRLSNWTLEHGYDINDDISTYPSRALFAGVSWALQAVLNVNEDDMDYHCRDGIQGFKIQLGHPSKMPRTFEHHFRMPLDSLVQAAVTPKIIATSDSVKKYDPHIRNCYFPTERHLKYFKIYTQENCQIECITNYTYNQCGCMDFYMPKPNDTPVCSQGQVHCLYKAEIDLTNSLVQRNLEILRGETSMSKDKIVDECDCLPACNSIRYDVEISTSPWKWRNIKLQNFSDLDKKFHKTYFQIFFKSNQFMSSERNELYGITTFLGNFGGLLGLFTGFSLLSLIEIIYYLSLRIAKNIQLYGQWIGLQDQ